MINRNEYLRHYLCFDRAYCAIRPALLTRNADTKPTGFNAFPRSPPDIPSRELKYAPRSVFHADVRRDTRCCYVSAKGVVVYCIFCCPRHDGSRRKQCGRYVKECRIQRRGRPRRKGRHPPFTERSLRNLHRVHS